MNGPCPSMQEQIADYVLAVLEEPQTEAVRKHLAECPQCRAYAQALQQQSEALAALGDEVKSGMAARQERAMQAFDAAAPGRKRSPWLGRLAPMAVAALLVLGVGITIGRLTAPKPIDVEQLRADLQASVHASVLADVDRRLEPALAADETRLKTEIVELLRQDLRTFATDVVSNSEQMMDRRFDEFVRLIEAARLKDRQRVVRAFEQVELNRRRDRTQIGQGVRSLVALTSASPTPTNNCAERRKHEQRAKAFKHQCGSLKRSLGMVDLEHLSVPRGYLGAGPSPSPPDLRLPPRADTRGHEYRQAEQSL